MYIRRGTGRKLKTKEEKKIARAYLYFMIGTWANRGLFLHHTQ
jgi:hypothetical protein